MLDLHRKPELRTNQKSATIAYLLLLLAATTVLFATVVLSIFASVLITTFH
jgi:hypothetical protein